MTTYLLKLFTSFFLVLGIQVNSQNIDKLIKKADGGDLNAQYEVGALFFSNLEGQPKKQIEKLKSYYIKHEVLDSFTDSDTIVNDSFHQWINENYFYYISESAKNNNDRAQLSLGKYYESLNEYGSEIKAYKWCLNSAKNNNIEAIKWIEEKNSQQYLKWYLIKEEYEKIDFYSSLIDLSEILCYYTNKGAFNKDLDKQIEKELLKFLNLSKDDENYNNKLGKFWNSYNKFFICFDDDSIIPEHILKRSLNELIPENNTILFNWLFELNQEIKINFNQVIYYNNVPETILDFLNKIIKNRVEFQYFSSSDIIHLRNKLIKTNGAKVASVLIN